MGTPVTAARSRWARSRRPYRPPRARVDLGSVWLDGAGSRTGRINPTMAGPFGVRPTLRSSCPGRIRLGPPLGHRSPRPGSDSRGRSGRWGLRIASARRSAVLIDPVRVARRAVDGLLTREGRRRPLPRARAGFRSPLIPSRGRGHDTADGLVGEGPEHLPGLAVEDGGLQSRRGHGPPQPPPPRRIDLRFPKGPPRSFPQVGEGRRYGFCDESGTGPPGFVRRDERVHPIRLVVRRLSRHGALGPGPIRRSRPDR